ncbi:MAG: TonB-dependent receptor [Balneolaceae bacterium]|nr:TonB-dependent receptor [Balneolaceae bacterium]MBO6547107.1 TonB-dependent receptor [Balneolaceae bacterium]MBO6647946.1 TonB-dependent receptor [Balneolaceae bacterium]
MSKQIRRLFFCLLLLTGVGTTLEAHPEINNDVTEVAGRVVDSSGEPLAGVNIRVKDKLIGTTTNPDGTFSLRVSQDPPLTLVFSIVGFQSVEVDVNTSTDMNIDVVMEEQTVFGDDIVVSASRVEQSILKSPVSIEKMDVLDIQTAASADFYASINNLKGVDFSTQSLTFKSINTRGFGSNGNTRFVQLIDGIDNQAPGLNFAVGNIVGISELDLESAEMIPGAASALYGPNALNGILLMKSKSPFDYQGLSVNIKQGVNHIDSNVEDPSHYQSYDARYAKAFNNKFAFKITASYLNAQDFVAQDTRDQSFLTAGAVERGVTERGDARVYNGVNIYGDDVFTLGALADATIAGGGATGAQVAALRSLVPDGQEGAFSAPGFAEASFVDNTTESLKLGAALHYRVSDNLEALVQYNTGFGSTVYTANDRFVLDDFNIWTAKFELRNPNFFIRAYTTQEDAGDSYAANTVATRINQQVYLTPYFQTFLGARTQGASVEQAHVAAEAAASANQADYLPGSDNFKQLEAQLRATSIADGGARFVEKSDMYHVEGLYNFSNIIDPETVELIAGANFRQYALNSEATLFALTDDGEEYDINEWGAYFQATKNLLDGDLSLSASARYDKNEYFEGQFSPRVSALYTVAEDHNFRVSYQNGFRMPTTQDQFIQLDVVTRLLIGSNQDLVDRYRFESNTVYQAQSVAAARATLNGGGTEAQARAQLVAIEFEEFKTEKISTYEVGYKGFITDNLLLDAYYYYSEYTDFIAEIQFVQGVPNGLTNDPGAFDADSDAGKDQIINGGVLTQEYGFDINADGKVKSQGFGVSLDYSLTGGYKVGGNVAYNELISADDLERQGFRSSYNTPKWRYNVKLENRKVVDNIGFNMVYRWQDAYFWDSSFGDGVVPAYGTLDAQVSYKLPDYNTVLKIGGSNILNERYTTSFGNPLLGAIYYFSITFDQFLN